MKELVQKVIKSTEDNHFHVVLLYLEICWSCIRIKAPQLIASLSSKVLFHTVDCSDLATHGQICGSWRRVFLASQETVAVRVGPAGQRKEAAECLTCLNVWGSTLVELRWRTGPQTKASDQVLVLHALLFLANKLHITSKLPPSHYIWNLN